LIDEKLYTESGSEELKFDSLADLYASLDEGWIFQEWTVDLKSSSTDETLEVVKYRSIKSNFFQENVVLLLLSVLIFLF